MMRKIILGISLCFITSSTKAQIENYTSDAMYSYCAALYEGEYLASKNTDFQYARLMRFESEKFLFKIKNFKDAKVRIASEDAISRIEKRINGDSGLVPVIYHNKKECQELLSKKST